MYPQRGSKILLRLPKKIVEAQYSTEPMKLEKVLLLNKMSRIESEKFFQPDLTSEKLESDFKKRGIDYNDLAEHNEINKRFRHKVRSSLERFGIDVRSTNRFCCLNSDIEWCDAVISVGGDGTFLNCARRITDTNKPVIGFNSNPLTSEGFLCLPQKYSTDIESAIRKLLEGKFKWLFRTRIRVNLSQKCLDQTPIDFHDLNFGKCELLNFDGEEKIVCNFKNNNVKLKPPILALNEVFISEIFSGKVSYFDMRVNNCSQRVKIKSSGLCVCTGTGSTSWHLSINNLRKQDVREILKNYIEETKGEMTKDFEALATRLADNFNEKLKFGAEELIMGYTVRDLILLGVWPSPKGLIEPRGFAETVEVKSKCKNAGLIIDGGVSFPFNEGTVANLETRPSDALRCVVLLD